MAKLTIETLYIAEKHSVMKALAEFLANKYGLRAIKDEWAYFVGDKICVSYTHGHILQMEPPNAYITEDQNKGDPFAYLPLFPGTFKYRPRFERNKDGSIKERSGKPVEDKHFFYLEKLIKTSKTIVNAGDVGREGQLIQDELYRYVGFDPTAKNFLRWAVNDLNPTALAASFANLEPNGGELWQRLGAAGQARQEADWLIGYNASRAYWSVTGSRTTALGRIKAPVLAIVSQRCQEIEQFKPSQFYVPILTLKDGVEMRWQSRANSQGTAGFDEQGRIIDALVAQQIVNKINQGAAARVGRVRKDLIKKPPPLGYNLSGKGSLTEAVCRQGYTLEEADKAIKSLYEKHKAISYIGTECKYFPETMLAQARGMMKTLSPLYRSLSEGGDYDKHPASFSDKKVAEDEHHAIAPTGVVPHDLDAVEKTAFDAVVRRFAAQFYPDYQYLSLVIEGKMDDDLFAAKQTQPVQQGWRIAEGLEEAPDEDDATNDISPKASDKEALNHAPTE